MRRFLPYKSTDHNSLFWTLYVLLYYFQQHIFLCGQPLQPDLGFLDILKMAIWNWILNIGVSGKYSSLGKSDSAERISMPWYLGNFFSALHCLPLHCTALWDISKVFRIQIELLSPSLTTAGGDQLRKEGERAPLRGGIQIPPLVVGVMSYLHGEDQISVGDLESWLTRDIWHSFLSRVRQNFWLPTCKIFQWPTACNGSVLFCKVLMNLSTEIWFL